MMSSVPGAEQCGKLVVRGNVRAGAALACLGGGILALGMVWLLWAPRLTVQIGAGLLAGAGACLTWLGLWFVITPRLLVQEGKLRVWLGATQRVEIPLEHVEAFLLQQGPVARCWGDRCLAANLVIRVAEKAQPWSSQRGATWLVLWCGPYLALRGMWLEPLSVEKVNRWNALLARLKQHHRGTSADDAAGSAKAPAAAR